jgi:hypothetical protein
MGAASPALILKPLPAPAPARTVPVIPVFLETQRKP